MEQLLLHLWGDYILQGQWMAENKVKHWWPAIVHATVYSLPFFFIGSWQAVLVILATHAVIDRYRLARFVVYFKNIIFVPPGLESLTLWRECNKTGYPPSVPDWLAVWLLIIADNTLHLTINYLALRFL